MTIVDIERTCTSIPEGGAQNGEAVSKPLAGHRRAAAYVLLGDPGAGKTTSFKREREHTPGAAEKVIDARDFVTLEVAAHPEWHSRTLFIDGLDEVRAGSQHGRTVLDKVRARLETLGRPRFRLSCREADWLGPNDWARLKTVAPEGELAVLRLDALTLDDVHRIVEASQLVDNAEQFIEGAGNRGLQELLFNPQTLELLIEAVGGAKQWPASRLETFELACRQLAKEENEEHQAAERDRPGREQLMEAAGRVCALLLLSGTAGVDLSSVASDESNAYPALAHLDPHPAGTLPAEARASAHLRRLAVSSRLFSAASAASPNSRRFEPVHRHIAEFLAGRYLAQRIDAGLPAARAVALITAGDGGVVTPHRGLSAWLAVHSKPARPELIERDPIGVGLYGDVSRFDAREKQSLLRALIREGRRLHSVRYRTVSAFAPLATPELEAQFAELLKTKPHSDDDQLSVEFVLKVLRHGAPMPALAETVLAIVYQPDWWPRVTYRALDAFLRQCADTSTRNSKLEQLLNDIEKGAVVDPDNELAARVLRQLYPRVISPHEVWSHLALSKPTKLFGAHWDFWTRRLQQETRDEDLALLLDKLVCRRPDLDLVGELSDGRALAERLLARGLAAHGEHLTPERLYKWLGAPARTYLEFHELKGAPDSQEASVQVRSWLEEHPDAFKMALLEGLRRYTDEQDLNGRWILAKYMLRHAQPPSDFGRWCLDQAQSAAHNQPALARLLFGQARRRLGGGESGLTQALFDECVRQHPIFRPPPTDPKVRERIREEDRRHEKVRSTHAPEQERKEREWLHAVRAEAPALRENRGAAPLLHKLAWDWFQRRSGQPLSLLDWLRTEFANEADLAAAAHQGLIGVIHRTDLPDVDEITRLHGESRMHHLSMPFLVALEDMAKNDPAAINGLTEEQQRQALASYLCVRTDGMDPSWYGRLVKENRDLAESVLLPFARAELRRGSGHVAGLHQLVHAPDHAELARLISLRLLRGFPVRCHARQLPNLIRLLWAALQHTDQHELLELVDKKLAGKSMTVAQRVHWLAAGVIAAPDVYATRLCAFIDGKELRARHLAHFLWSEYPVPFHPDALPPYALEILIRQLGSAFGMYELKDGIVGPREEALTQIPGLIEVLTASPDPEAGAALDRLASDEALSRWRHGLRLASDEQAVIARDASYQRPETDRVRATLDNLAPANAADLAALALDRLDEFALSTRQSNTNVWSQYWNQDSHGRPTDPKPENACRDALLAQLRQRLPAEVDAQPEGQYAANRRADIRLACSDFHVPIEIKKHSHPALWRAARDQLVANYTQDPATGGYGIFLVLWFGDPMQTPLDETGSRPGSPEELQLRLEAAINRQLTPEQARKIAVRVIDVSKP